MNNHPPKLPQNLLNWLLKEELAEEVLGDLEEKFHITTQHRSTFRAKLNYWYQVLNYLRPFAIKNYRSNSNQFTMQRHNFKIALRHLVNEKGFAFINIFSLTVGIAACMAIYLFIADESSFDSFHSKKSNIYRLDEIQTFTGTKEQHVALSMPGMGPSMLNEFPEVKGFTRFDMIGKHLFRENNNSHVLKQTALVDSTFLEVFDFILIRGDKSTALDEPHSLVLTEDNALKFFDNYDDALGASILMNDRTMKVTGILKNIPENSHLQFDALLSFTSVTAQRPEFNNSFGSNTLNTYLVLEDNVSVSDLEAKFDDFMLRHFDNDNTILEYYKLYLQPLTDVHLQSAHIEHDYDNYRKFNGKYLHTFKLVGIFILAIACINFMNLSIARASKRWKEVGIRKTIGAVKNQLFYQFMVESILLAVLAMLLSFALLIVALPILNNAIGRELTLMYFLDQPQLVLITIILTLALGFIAGLYPALYMTNFQVASIFRGKRKDGDKSFFRNALIVLQFGLALAMIVSTLVVLQQLNYMQAKDVGYDTDKIMLIDMANEANENFKPLKDELLNLASVSGVTASGQRLGNNFHQWGFKVKYDTGIYTMTPSNVYVERDYLDVYGIKILEGRGFSKDIATDNGLAFIINKSLAKELGLKEAVGTAAAHQWYPDDSLGSIIGVTEDFNFNSLHHRVNTLCISAHEDWNYSEMSIKISGKNLASTIEDIEYIWSKHVKDWPMEYTFLDNHLATLYESDTQMSTVVSIITVLAILIACLGLFGLSSILISRKVKEIGIRKVLGASVGHILLLVSRNFVLMIVVAFVVVSPITYLLLEGWLSNFAFRVDLNIALFIIGGAIALAVAIITISFQSIKAALTNPVNSLRSE